eukprot:SAG11_NODE_200_length_12606_cov_51.874550_3_plen_255_part_00
MLLCSRAAVLYCHVSSVSRHLFHAATVIWFVLCPPALFDLSSLFSSSSALCFSAPLIICHDIASSVICHLPSVLFFALSHVLCPLSSCAKPAATAPATAAAAAALISSYPTRLLSPPSQFSALPSPLCPLSCNLLSPPPPVLYALSSMHYPPCFALSLLLLCLVLFCSPTALSYVICYLPAVIRSPRPLSSPTPLLSIYRNPIAIRYRNQLSPPPPPPPLPLLIPLPPHRMMHHPASSRLECVSSKLTPRAGQE